MRLVQTIAATVTGTALLFGGGAAVTATAAQAAAPITLGCSAAVAWAPSNRTDLPVRLTVTDALGNGTLSVLRSSTTWATGSMVATNAQGRSTASFPAIGRKGEKVTVQVSGSRGGIAWSCATAYIVR
jgi:hypothetical protein